MMHRSLLTISAILFAFVGSSFPVTADDVLPVESAKSSLTKRWPHVVVDCRLAADNSFSGRVLDQRGKPLAHAQVVLARPASKPMVIKTTKQGQFRCPNLSPGTAALTVGRQTRQIRLWNANVAPPGSRKELMFVTGDVVRGQCDANCSGCEECSPGYTGHFGGFFQRILHNPWIVGAGIATAIAVPLATDDDDAS